MKTIISLFIALSSSLSCLGQINIESFVGTWQYCNGDSVFTIKLQKGEKKYYDTMVDAVYGGYSLSINGRLVEDYISNMTFSGEKDPNAYIRAFVRFPEKMLPMTFFDQRKKHINGKGIWGELELLPSGQLHWTLNEENTLWHLYEGGPIPIPEPIGCSVPINVLMNKVE